MSELKRYFAFIIILGVQAGCLPLPSSSGASAPTANVGANKPLITQNHNYEPRLIRSIRLTPSPKEPDDRLSPLRPPLAFLGMENTLLLSFDCLGNNPPPVRLKIVYCTWDWKVANINEIEYLNEINDFLVINRRPSAGTRVPYFHYTFLLPRLKLSGNYLLVAYREGNAEDYLFTQRFVLYENLVNIQAQTRFSTINTAREQNQQIDFKINYAGYSSNIFSPNEDFKVVIRQNYRWDNAIVGLRPLYVRDFDKMLEYTYFNGENNFGGSNEYRRFDTRSVRFLGIGMSGIKLTDTLAYITLQADQVRANTTYFTQPDWNGSWLPGHYETGGNTVEPDYVRVIFTLRAAQQPQPVHVVGAFNQWLCTDENKMFYMPDQRAYGLDLLLKQGEYNYMYALADGTRANNAPIEGDYSGTENVYDILVYHRPPGARSERLVGYQIVSTRQ